MHFLIPRSYEAIVPDYLPRKRELSSDEIPSPIRRVGDDPRVEPLREVAPGHYVAAHRVGGAY